MGEIALKVLKQKLRTEGMFFGNHASEKLRVFARSAGVDFEKLKAFMSIVSRELTDETFTTNNTGSETTKQ